MKNMQRSPRTPVRKILFIAAAAGAALFVATPGSVAAQVQVSFEARGSLQSPTGDFGDRAAGDVGLTGDVILNLSPRLSIYGGCGFESFGCDGCPGDNGFDSEGFEAGAKLLFARESRVLPWVNPTRRTSRSSGTTWCSRRT